MKLKNLFKWTVGLFLLFVTMLLFTAGVSDPQIGRAWWPEAKAYIDSVSAHRTMVLYVDEVGDQTLAKFALEEDITIERVSFFSQAAISGDTTGLYFYEGTAIRDSCILDSGIVYKEFPANFNWLNDSSFVEVKLNDAQWGGTAAGGTNAQVIIQYRTKQD